MRELQRRRLPKVLVVAASAVGAGVGAGAGCGETPNPPGNDGGTPDAAICPSGCFSPSLADGGPERYPDGGPICYC